MSFSGELQGILASYQEDLKQLDQSLRPGDGILGFGRVPGNDLCHERLDERIAALTKRVTQANSDRQEAAELVRMLLRCDAEFSLPVYAQTMLVAVQRHALPLISRLTRNEARELRLWYEKQYPRFKRMPVQKEVLRALKQIEQNNES